MRNKKIKGILITLIMQFAILVVMVIDAQMEGVMVEDFLKETLLK
jgi:hypothetical protein